MGKKKQAQGHDELEARLCTPALAGELCGYLIALIPLNAAATLCRLSPSVVLKWIRWGRRELNRVQAAGPGIQVRECEKPFVDFYLTVREPVIYAELHFYQPIAKKNPKVLLQRWFPCHWTHRKKLDHRPKGRVSASVGDEPLCGSSGRTGRPSVCTSDLTHEFCDLLGRFIDIETAASLCGLDRGTVYNWLDRGDREWRTIEDPGAKEPVHESEAPYLQFVIEVRHVQSLLECYLVARAWNLSPEWVLARRFQERWDPDSKRTPDFDQLPYYHLGTSDEELVRRIKAQLEEHRCGVRDNSSKTGNA